jgi:hypothetical protein
MTEDMICLIEKLCKCSFQKTTSRPKNALSFKVGTYEFFAIQDTTHRYKKEE